MLSKWFGTSRYAYNKAISLLNDEDTPTNFKGLVPVVLDELPDWHKETPRQIKAGAIMDACQAVGNAKVKVFLKQKAKEYGVQVKDVCEAYTSKTVSWTGELVANLGGSKVIKSSEGQSMDRDLNGARGIFIKTVARALTVRPYLA